MKFQYSEKKVKLPENVHAYAEKKVMKLARYFEDDAEALIVFSVERNQNKAELTVHGAVRSVRIRPALPAACVRMPLLARWRRPPLCLSRRRRTFPLQR